MIGKFLDEICVHDGLIVVKQYGRLVLTVVHHTIQENGYIRQWHQTENNIWEIHFAPDLKPQTNR